MKKIIFFVALFVLLITNVSGYDNLDIINKDEVENLVTGISKDILGDISIDSTTNIAENSISILDRVKMYAGDIYRDLTKTMVKIIVILVISSIGIGFCSSNELSHINSYINMATAITIASIVLIDVKSVLTMSMDAINEIDILSKGLMPSMVAAISISGAPTAAALNYSATMFVFDLLITFINRILYPFIYIYVTIITVNAAIGNDILDKLCGFIRWFSQGSLKIIITLFITYITLTGVISGTADTLAIKTTKLAISSFVPVVGSIISDASESILVGASIVKNSIGIFGIFAVISICLIPIIKIILNFFMFKITSVLVAPISSPVITKLLDGISNAFNLSLAMISSCAAILFIMMVVSITLVRTI